MKFLIIFFYLFFNTAFSNEKALNINKVFNLKINSTINPSTFNYLALGFKEAQKEKNSAILISMNTPGGFVSTTKKILTLIGESSVPVFVWVGPEGASATSAGALISSGAHLLFMARGTNIGAATPIKMSGNIEGKKDNKSDLRAKAINDLVALVSSLSKTRNRNDEAFAKMVSEAKSFSAKEALEKNAIDAIISKKIEIKDFINNKIITLKGQKFKILVNEKLEFKTINKRFSDTILDVFSNPQLAYILFLIGAALLYFEMQAPGGFIAGATGVVFLIIAAMSFQLLPINLGAAGLVILSFILFILEAYITSYGILSLTGIFSLTFGSLLLFETADSLISLNKTFIFSTSGSIFAVMIFIAYQFIKNKKQNTEKIFELIGEIGKVQKKLDTNFYQIKIAGSFWKAKSPCSLEVGESVKVISKNKEKLILNIEKV